MKDLRDLKDLTIHAGKCSGKQKKWLKHRYVPAIGDAGKKVRSGFRVLASGFRV